MAYDKKNLSVLSTANGFTLWHYKTTDLASDVDTTGYFNESIDMLKVNDMIMANTSIDATAGNGIFVVKSNDGTNVDVSNISAFGLANTD